jgi:lipid-binding SYLF domain-containing protein
MRLRIALISIIYTGLLALVMSPAQATPALDKRVDAATEVLQQLTNIPEKSIPPTLLRNAYAVAVIPNRIKAGFMIAGSYGKGVLVVRQDDGGWSNPAFISMGAGSFGWQVGGQSSDIILVFKSRKGVDNIAKGKLTLGGDASIAAGPVGRQASAATDLRLSAEIYSYSRNRGLFAGVSVEGSVIGIDHKSNTAYYGAGQDAATQILADQHIPAPAHARRFIEVLTAKAPSVQPEPNGSRTAASSPSRDSAAEDGAKTFAVDDAPTTTTDTVF